MTRYDWLYMALTAVLLAVDHFLAWPAFLRRSGVNETAPRLRLWLWWMSLLWVLTAIGLLLWYMNKRSLALLGMSMPVDWRLWGSAALVIGFVLIQARSAWFIAKLPGPKPKLRAQLGELSEILPHSSVELWVFMVVSVSAGICEEFLFRGYLIWAFGLTLGWWGAAALSLALFAAAHSYQGKSGALRAGIGGGLLTLLVAASGSILPAIVLHTLMDASSGVVAWLILRERHPVAGQREVGNSST